MEADKNKQVEESVANTFIEAYFAGKDASKQNKSTAKFRDEYLKGS